MSIEDIDIFFYLLNIVPGFSSEIRLVTKEENEIIEIHPLKTEHTGNNSFTLEDFFNHILPEEIGVRNIDISKITFLELSKCNLIDLPIACTKLNLKYLGLSHNNFEHVPLCLYNGLKNLESIDLSYNQIKNFDLEPDCMSHVRKMRLNNNKFDNVPKWFLMFRCTNMEEFNYSQNKAKTYKYMKNSFNVNLLKLKKLELVSSCLIDDDFNLLKCFKHLQYLDISNVTSPHTNRFHDLDDLFVKPKWKELTVLKLNNLSLSLFPEGIAWIESLRELYAAGNSLSWLSESIEYLVNLEVLVVSNNTLVSLPKCLTSLERLTVLQASNNYIDGVPDFSSMLNLKTLDLYGNSLEMISFNVNTVDFVDLEFNYCETKEFKKFSLYEEKKNNLREKYSFAERYDGVKIRQSDDSTDSYSEMDSYYDSMDENTNSAPVVVDETENWDLPSKTWNVHSDIDSEDERWQGEEIKTYLGKTCETKRVYVSDDDWMFEDCDS